MTIEVNEGCMIKLSILIRDGFGENCLEVFHTTDEMSKVSVSVTNIHEDEYSGSCEVATIKISVAQFLELADKLREKVLQ